MYCPKCGQPVPDGAAFCPNCGNQLGAARTQTGYVPPTDQVPPASAAKIVTNSAQQGGNAQGNPDVVYVVQQPAPKEDNGSFGWAVLGFFIPLVGLILWLVWKDEKPKSAHQAGMGALVCVICGIVLYLLVIVFAAMVTTAAVSSYSYY